MLKYLSDHPELILALLSVSAVIIGNAIHLYYKLNQNSKDIESLKQKEKEDIENLKADFGKGISMLKEEIDEIKDCYVADIKQVLDTLTKLSNSVSKIQGYIEGQQSKNC